MTIKATRARAMLSKCHDCSGGYLDGKEDCEVVACPLYPWMPYRKREPNLGWTKINPKRPGNKEILNKPGRAMSAEHKRALLDGLAKNRVKKYEEAISGS